MRPDRIEEDHHIALHFKALCSCFLQLRRFVHFVATAVVNVSSPSFPFANKLIRPIFVVNLKSLF